MQARDLFGIGSGFVGQVSVGEPDAQFLMELETSKVGAKRSVLAEVA